MNFELCFLTLVEWICTQKFSLIILYKQHLSWPSHSLTPFLLYSHLKVKHRLKEKKTKQTKPTSFISAVAGGRRPVTSEISQHLTLYGGACWRLMGHRTRPGVPLYLSLTLSTPHLRSDMRWEPEIIPARSVQSSEPWLPAKTRSDTCINTAEREKRNSISRKRPLSKRRLLNSMKAEIHTQEECQGNQLVARAPHHDLHQLLSPSW